MSLNPREYYAQRGTRFRDEAAAYQRQADRVSDYRLGVFLLGLGLGLAAWMGRLPWEVLAVPVLGFVGLAIWHEQIHRKRATAELGERVYAELLARLNGSPPVCRFESRIKQPVPHLYSRDLDLFGRGGLFELVCRTGTLAGAQMLADWLLAPAGPDLVADRQAAVRELTERRALRESLALVAAGVERGVSPDDLRHWAEEPARIGVGWRIPVACVLAALAAASIPGALVFGGGLPVLVLSANILFLFSCRAGFALLDRSLEPIGRELRTLSAVLVLLEEEPFGSALLRDEAARLKSGTVRASAAIGQLERFASGFEMYRNQLFIVIALFTLWPFWWGWAIECWRARHRDDLHHVWMDALGRLEALCSLAGYAFERPEDAWPEIVVGAPCFVAEGLGHPLLPESQRVRNDVTMDSGVRLLMVSGSNMSGKSTLLRSIGLNAVLAQAGAPVCAQALRMSPLQPGAVIRVEDSIQRGASRFYAEIERFKMLLDLETQGRELLFLCDEILHGTNTRDRVIGARALIRALLECGGIGLVTTHDLALTEFVAQLPAARNVHFQDDMRDGRLAFDYHLRDGVVTKSNALDLMRAIGLPVTGEE